MSCRAPAILSLLLAAALAALAPAQEWETSFARALETAKQEKKPVLALFTVSELCPNCAAIDDQVFTKDSLRALGKEFVLVRVDFADRGRCRKSERALGAALRLTGYPTIYALDPDGYPTAALSGYEPGKPESVETLLAEARREAKTPARLRADGRKGVAELRAWYVQRGLPFGETLACAALEPDASRKERAAMGPVLIASVIAQGDADREKRIWAAVKAEDPKGASGFLPATLLAAGNFELREGDCKAAAARFEGILALAEKPSAVEIDAHFALGYAYRKLEAPCLSFRHYERAAVLASAAKTPEGEAIEHCASSEAQMVAPCRKKPCGCDAKQVRAR